MLTTGFVEEAYAWREWLLRAITGDPADMQIMYGLDGSRRLLEYELGHLPGYEHSRPVRVGNAASEQVQLDVYGEVMDALHLGRVAGLPHSDHTWELQTALLEHLEGNWMRPDEGIWEVRGPRRHFTHSRVMSWVAFDRAATAVRHFGCAGDATRWEAIRDRIHAEVCAKAYDADKNAFTQSYGDPALDASLLVIPAVGFLPASDPRVVGTVDAIGRELSEDGFILRYRTPPVLDGDAHDGLPPGEGAFLACSFWYVDALARTGRTAQAIELFERLLSLRNDVGLLAEEYEPALGRQVGNFPQAFSHVPLVTAANTLSAIMSGADPATLTH